MAKGFWSSLDIKEEKNLTEKEANIAWYIGSVSAGGQGGKGNKRPKIKKGKV